MATIQLFYDGLENLTAFNSATEADAVNYPVENLQDRDVDTKYETTATNPSDIILDYGSAKTADSIAFGGLTHGGTVTTTISYSADNVTYTAVTAQVGGSLSTGHNVITFTSASARYWKIHMLAGNVFIGSLYLGTRLQFTTAPVIGRSEGRETSGVTKTTTINGKIRTNKKFGNRKTWNYHIEAMFNAQKVASQTFYDAITGNFYPFIFTDTDGTVYNARMNQKSLVMKEKSYGYWNATFNLIEEL